MLVDTSALNLDNLQARFGPRFRVDVPLAPYTSARIGGPARGLITVNNREQLAEAMLEIWQNDLPYFILGGGSNVLVSDAGFNGLVVLNRARKVVFHDTGPTPGIWAESGASLGLIARQAAARGLGGLAWAAGIPGTLGGAIVGNAGAHGSDMNASLAMAEILQHTGQRDEWPPERLGFTYRSSLFKGTKGRQVILAGMVKVVFAAQAEIQEEMEQNLAYRRTTQPPGASMGSMFKNPPHDYAGRLIEGAGLKGFRIGAAQISPLHGNFFINHGGATGRDVRELIEFAAKKVFEQNGIELELEVELIGEWPQNGR